tara:strand:+ start:557 stop:949 length:393 start_codon:yes stop_codon:yes gene_type:complete
MLLSDTALYAIIFAVLIPFLGILFLLSTARRWSQKNITLTDAVCIHTHREKSAVISEDPEIVRVITRLAQIEKLTKEDQTQASVKNKARLLLRLRKRVKINFPKMSNQEVEAFCCHLHSLAKTVAHKKIK